MNTISQKLLSEYESLDNDKLEKFKGLNPIFEDLLNSLDLNDLDKIV